MSKSRGNVVNPDDVDREYGADAMRLYEMFMGPLEQGRAVVDRRHPGRATASCSAPGAWSCDERRRGEPARALAPAPGTRRAARGCSRTTIAKVTEDIEALRFNTAISKLMVFVRDVDEGRAAAARAVEAFVLLLAPLAPHLAEELWQRLGHASRSPTRPGRRPTPRCWSPTRSRSRSR